MQSSNHRLGGYVLAGIVAFVLICSAAQLLRTDLDWVKAPLSFYLGWLTLGAIWLRRPWPDQMKS